MPKDGFKTITIKDWVYEKFKVEYTIRQEKLFEIGICSLSAWISHSLEKLEKESKLRFSLLADFKTHIVILDRWRKNMFTIDDKWNCSCKRENCIHIGFSYSLKETDAW